METCRQGFRDLPHRIEGVVLPGEGIVMSRSDWVRVRGGTGGLLQRARELYAQRGEPFRRHPRLPALLGDYRRAIAQTGALSARLGLPAMCTSCAARKEVCCFRGVERRYDENLLLLNLLLGVSLPGERRQEDACWFCGPRGCLLVAKHSFCLNFYCQALKETLGGEGLARLRRQVGLELMAQWELDRVMVPWLAAPPG